MHFFGGQRVWFPNHGSPRVICGADFFPSHLISIPARFHFRRGWPETVVHVQALSVQPSPRGIWHRMTEHAFSLKIDVLFPPPQEAFPATSIDCSDKHHAYAVIALRGGGSSPLLAGPAAPRGVGSPGFVFFFCSLAGEGAAEKSSCTSERSARKKQQKKAKNKIKKSLFAQVELSHPMATCRGAAALPWISGVLWGHPEAPGVWGWWGWGCRHGEPALP